MISKLINWLFLLINWHKKSKKDIHLSIPNLIDYRERLCRSIYSPINIDSKGNLKSNVFRPPADLDEISVNRLDHTTADYCKALSKKNQNTHRDRNYYGLAIILQSEVLDLECETIYTPILDDAVYNPFHADIKIGYVPKKGEELPGKFRKKVDDLRKRARFYIDPSPESFEWKGAFLK